MNYYCCLNLIVLVALLPIGFVKLQIVFENQPIDANADFDDLQRRYEERMKYTDRRAADNWRNLLPFGELFYDIQLLRQPSLDRQIDFNFYFPFYGFRFNYTFISPNGLLAFSRPEYIQPPYTFPNPLWPEQRDPSFIAPFLAQATYQYIGETPISNVWYRTVHRPRAFAEGGDFQQGVQSNIPASVPIVDTSLPNPFDTSQINYQDRMRQYGGARRQVGFVEDDYLLDNITRDIQEGIVGANGFRALHAFVVTWERMAYGGAPKVVQVNRFNEVRQWQNTFQTVLATDEIRSYVMINYATLNWTASNEAGALRGRGGYQAAIAGFNAGNGTAFTPMPYNGEGEMFKLARFSSVSVPGRWVFRVDEEIIPGGCLNASIGTMTVAPNRATMLGGLAVNVSGPCIREGDRIVVLFDEFTVNCKPLNMHRARCILPEFHKIGLINTKFSRDGGMSYPYWGHFYVVQPDRSEPNVMLVRDVLNPKNNWDQAYAEQLEMWWAPLNLTSRQGAQVNIDLMGYWEDTEQRTFRKVGVLADNVPNDGKYIFDPRSMSRTNYDANAWEWYNFGSIRVSVDDRPEDGVFFSHLTPFSFFFVKDWEYQLGDKWALEKCIEWFDYDGRRRNFIMDLQPCPCVMEQAQLDQGRYMPVFHCDNLGDSSCPYNRGAQLCVQSVQASWTGAQQTCCYDFEGWLMHSDDVERENVDQLRFFSPGTPYRAHTFGAYPYKIPPYVPSMSNYYNDLMPYHICCKYAKHCEFYFWRRQTHTCQDYRPPAAGMGYGDAHFITYDGARYTFNGKGFYVLTMSDHSWHKLMVQIRLEQPPKTLWGTYPNATVITGVAVRENDSDVVQVLARKEFRRWRYRTDVTVQGIPRFFDSPEWKFQQFRGISLFSPARNMNQSEIVIQLRSGVGVRVMEGYGILNVAVFLPPSYNMTYKYQGYNPNGHPEFDLPQKLTERFGGNVNQDFYKTMGLLGVFNGDIADEYMTMGGGQAMTGTNRQITTAGEAESIYTNFGEKWRVDGSDDRLGPVLFDLERTRPIYNPLAFSENRNRYRPEFDPLPPGALPFDARYIFSLREVRDACQNNWACSFDYASTGRREIGLNTMSVEQKFIGLKQRGGRRLVSCGALLKAQGAVKSPIGNNYLDGVTVTFTCRPDFFIHGDQQRTCLNGTWTPGWHVWCRYRATEIFLKWLTGVLSTLGILAILAAIFFACYWTNVRPKNQERNASIRSRANARSRATPLRPMSNDNNKVIISGPIHDEKGPPSVFASTDMLPVLAQEPRGTYDAGTMMSRPPSYPNSTLPAANTTAVTYRGASPITSTGAIITANSSNRTPANLFATTSA